mgnify:CR=1 FL=1
MREDNNSAVMRPVAPMWLLVLVTLSGTMAMHIFVPALPIAGAALGAAPAGMQQTITLYVLGLALGQLVYGPLSDTLGRRPTLLVGNQTVPVSLASAGVRRVLAASDAPGLVDVYEANGAHQGRVGRDPRRRGADRWR